MVKKELYWKNPEKYRKQRKEQYRKNIEKERELSKNRQYQNYYCIPEWRERKLKQQRKWYNSLSKEEKDKRLDSNRKRWQENYQTKYKITHDKWYKEEHKISKEEVMKLCGNGKAECVLCGNNDIDILTIDHKNGRIGNARKTRDINNHHYGFPFWRKILKGKLDSSKYQTLCMNCNWKKHLNTIKKNI